MNRRIMAWGMAALMALSLAACGTATADVKTQTASADKEGKVFHIYAWDEEYKGLFERYYADRIPQGIEVKWTIVPSDDGAYQEALDNALLLQEDMAADDKVDLFLAEADSILNYVNSDATQDIVALGVEDLSNTYDYTVQACRDESGVIKGVSYQSCPAAVIYRRSIAEEVLGTDDPAEVQKAISDWSGFEALAAQAKEKGYLMTPSYKETFRAFFEHAGSPWVDAENNLQIDAKLEAWISQNEKLVADGSTLAVDIRDEKLVADGSTLAADTRDEELTAGNCNEDLTAQMSADGRTLCFFGSSDRLNSMTETAQDSEKTCFGDWAICQGPAGHLQGGSWLLAAAGSDNPSMLADIMNTFINDEAVCEQLVSVEHLLSNNQTVNSRYAREETYGREVLDGQNDIAVFHEIAKTIRFEKRTVYDELLNEGLQKSLQKYFQGTASREEAIEHFYRYANEVFPTITTP